MHADRFPPLAVLAGSIFVALTSAHPCRANMIGVDGVTCLLSDAITAANTDLPAGGCITGNGNDSIAIFGNQTLTAQLPVIASNIAFFGTTANSTTTVTGDTTHRLFFVGAPGIAPAVSFSMLTLAGGKATGGTGIDGGGGGAGLGGAVLIYAGNVSIDNTIFSTNTAKGADSTGAPFLFGTNGWIGSGGGGGGGMGGSGGSAAGAGSISGGPGMSMAFGGGGGGGGRGDTEFGGGGGMGGGGSFGGNAGTGGNSPTAGGAGDYGGGGGWGGAGSVPSASHSGGTCAFCWGGGGGGGQCFSGGGSSCGSAAGPAGPGGFGGGGGAGGSYVSQPPPMGGVGGFGGGGGANGKGEGGGSASAAGGFGAGNASFDQNGGGGAGFGGALFIRSGTLDVHNSTFQSNSAGGGANGGQGKGGAIAALVTLDNGNGNNQGMPTTLPRVSGCANAFAGDSASNAGSLARDNADSFGADATGLQLACNDRIFADGFGAP